jgi:hypothetical protein
MEHITITLSKQHLQIISVALAELPYRISAPVVEALRQKDTAGPAPTSSSDEQLWPYPQ